MSLAVRAAQEKLLELRRQRGITPGGRTTTPVVRRNDELRITNEERAPNSSLVVRHSSLHSEPLSLHLRAAAERRQRQRAADDRGWLEQIRITNDELRITNEERAPNSYLVSRISYLVRVYPDVALGILRRKKAAPGRVWLLLRHYDVAGRGRVSTAAAARLLAGDSSPTRICGRRQLANLLAAGDGLFWDRDTDRAGGEWLRLRSVARVAAGLGVARLGGSPVAVPLAELTGTIGRARAHLYAAFHSGRTRTDLLTGRKQARGPIARSTLCKLSSAAPNSQRNYERRAAVGRHSAIAIGPRAGSADDAADEHETAWRRGRAMFHLRDRAGRFGHPGAVYLAWQLPNEYTGPHATLPRGRMKRLNRTLADLFHDGMTGNDEGITNDELRVTSEEAAGGKWQVASGKWSVSSEQYLVVGRRESPLVSGHPSAVVGRPSAVAACRRFYNSAKAAYLARGEHEHYWRYGGVWLWQPEKRDTRYEIRAKNAADNGWQATDDKLRQELPPETF